MSRLCLFQSLLVATVFSGVFAVPALAGSAPAREVAFVDGAVADHEVLVAGVRPGVETVRLDPAGDALVQMATWAEAHWGYEAIHVVSHGAPGALRLGGASLDGAALRDPAVAGRLVQIGRALNRGGDLLLYGCEVAKGEAGAQFVADLAKVTGADVAASDDKTGAADKGGDWVLESAAGTLEASVVLNSQSMSAYTEVLADATLTFESGTGSFSGAGTESMTFVENTSGATFTFTAKQSGGSADNVDLGVSSSVGYPLGGGSQHGSEDVYFGVNDPDISATMTIESGKVFDLSSLYLSNQGSSPQTFTITTSKGGSCTTASIPNNTSLTQITLPNEDTGFQGITWFTITPTSAPAYMEIDDIVLTNIVAPPAFSGQYLHSFYDTEVANSFFNVAGMLTATPVGTATIAAYGISGTGVTTGGSTGIGGTIYDVSKVGSYGTLYLVSTGTDKGKYVYTPNTPVIETLSTEVVGTSANRVTKVDSFAVTATDSVGATAENAVSIDLTGQNDTPEITSGTTATVAENRTGIVYTATASDRDSGQTLSYSLAGTDAGLFAINSTTGEVSFNSAPNFEAPADSGGDNVYDITVTATDNAAIVTGFSDNNDSAPKDVQITVTDDTTAPAVATIARKQAGPVTIANTLVWRVTFTEAVTGVDLADFELTGDGAATATLGTVTAGATPAEYLVTATGVAGTGTLRLDVKASAGITDVEGYALAGGFTQGQSYTHVLGTVPVAWGYNVYGQLGLGAKDSAAHPLAAFVLNTGALAGKTVVAVAWGASHTLALDSDGKVYAWGDNSRGRLGIGSTTASLVPVAVNVDSGSALAGKTVVAIAAGSGHSLALCDDGTVVAWGYNSNGQVGDGSNTERLLPVAVAAGSGSALAGKTVVAITAGGSHSLALCSDGTVVSWGGNVLGQLGNGTLVASAKPVAVATDSESALIGKTATAIAAGQNHSLALCREGTVVAWGDNGSGQLGNGTTANATKPVAVATDSDSALSGKTIVAIAGGDLHSLALSSDGLVSAWGRNGSGRLGDGTTDDRLKPVPVATDSESALSGKPVVAIAAGESDSLALCSDGTVVSWGANTFGRLGDGTTAEAAKPVAVNRSAADGSALAGRVAYLLSLGSRAAHSVVLASPAKAIAVATPAAGTYKEGDTLTFALMPPLPVTVTGTPRLVLTVGTETRYATYASGSSSTSLVFTYTVQDVDNDTDGIAVASVIDLNGGTLVESVGLNLDPALPAYTLPVIKVDTTAPAVPAITSTAPAGITTSAAYTMTGTAEAGATVRIYNAGTLVDTMTADADGHWSCALTLDDGATALTVTATDAAGNVSTAASDASWTIDTKAPVVATIVRAQSGPVTLEDTLEWRVTFTEPVTGVDAGDFVVTSLAGGASGTISSVTGSDATYLVTVALAGTGRVRLDLVAAGSGIADAAAIPLSADFVRGQVYVASSSAMLVSWGYNGYGQLGDDTMTDASAPLPVLHGAIPTDQTVVSVVCGDSHSVALTAAGRVYAWGSNSYGQLGNGVNTSSTLPVAVSALAGETVVAVAAGANFSLAITDEGEVYAWGYNLFGQLGNGTTTNSNVPVAVSALAGKRVVAISAGGGFALALTGDGVVYAWGQNVLGQLGNGTYVGTVTTPAQVTGFSGRTVVAISCGASHTLALTADGAVYAWGYNYDGQLGIGTTTASNRPAEVTALSGQGVSALQAGTYHSLALTESGTVYAWGRNNEGQLGDGSQTNRLTPVAVGGLSGRSVIELSAGEVHTLALLADGSALICGTNERSVLGDCGVVSPALTPVPVATTNAMVGRALLALSTDVSRYSVLALAGPIHGALSVSPAGGNIGAGASIAFTVTFPSAVTVTGTPRLVLIVGTETRYATYTSGSGTTTLTFSYAVTSADNDSDGIEVTAFDLAGGSLLDAGGLAASVSLGSLDTSALRVDTAAPAPLTALDAVATGAGQIEITFTAPEACTVYFTALEASQTAGTAAQIVAGQDAAANPVRHGSLALAAGVPGSYTLKGLAAGTAYTVHATMADAVGNVAAASPLVATATTAAVPAVADMDWSPMTLDAPCGMDPQLAFAPDGTPYVAFQSTVSAGKLLVQRYAGGVWSPVGGTSGLSTGAAYASKMVFAPDGTPYVAYSDSGLAGKAVVKRFTGGAWLAVGADSGLSAGAATALSLAFAPDGTPWLAYTDSTLSSKALVCRYVAGAWAYVGSSTGATAAGATTLDLAFGPDGTAHLAFRNSADSGRPAVWFWSEAGAAWFAGDTTASLPAIDRVSLAAAPDGTLYIAYRNSADLTVGVARHLVATAWTQIGDSLPASTWLDLAVGADGVPFLCYRVGTSGSGYRAYVEKFDGAAWALLPTGASVSAGEVSYPSLEVARDGVPYVVCRDDTTNKAVVAKLAAAVTSVAVPAPAIYGEGQTLAFTVNYSGPISVTGTPRLPLTIGSMARYADYTATGSTSTALRFLYTVQADELDLDGVAVGAALDLNGGTMVEASGWNAGTTLLHVGGCSGIHIDGVAPDTTITLQPDNPSASASATFTFGSSDGTGVGHFEASLDDGAFATATSPASLTGLADGSHTFAVRAIDAAGNVDPSPAAYTWTVDTTAPAAPGIGAVTPTTVSGTAEPGATVEVFVNGLSVGTTTADADGHWSIAASLADGAYSLTAQATDAVGNTGTASASGAWTVDTTAPTITLPGFSNLVAGQVTLSLTSSENGTGYFTILSSTETAGTATQIKEGRDAAGTVTRYGALPLSAATAGTYIVGDLAALSSYTVAFVAADDAGNLSEVMTTTFTTAGIRDTVGMDWRPIDRVGHIDGVAYNPSLAFGPDGTPYLAYRDDDLGGKARVSRYDKAIAGWVSVGAETVSPDDANFGHLAVAPDGALYLAYQDASHSSRATVMKYSQTSGTWTPVGSVGFSSAAIYDPFLAFAPDGTMYIAYQEDSGSAAATVMRYNRGTDSWESVGSVSGSTTWALTHSLTFPSIAFASDGSLYLSYRDKGISSNYYAVVLKYENGGWATIGGASIGYRAYSISPLAIGLDGELYLAYADGASGGRATVRRFNGTSWDYVGSSGFSSGAINYPALTVAADGSLWLAYSDSGNGSRAAVMRYEDGGTAGWQLMGTSGFSVGSCSDPSIALAPDGTPFVAFQDAGLSLALSVEKLTPVVMKVEGSADGSYRAGTAITVAVDYGSPIQVTGSPVLLLTIGSTSRPARYVAARSTNRRLIFSYEVQPGDSDNDGIGIGATIELSGGTITGTDDYPALIALRNVPALTNVLVDTTNPNAPHALGLAAASDSGTAGNDNITRIAAPEITGMAEGGTTVALYDSDGATVLGSATAGVTGNWSITISALSAGMHTLSATATDAAGNTSVASSALTLFIDLTPPETTFVGLTVLSPSASTTATFPFSGSDDTGSGVAGYEASLDGAAYAAATSPVNLTGLSDGSHTFAVRAIDAAGNVDATPASYTWTVDTTAPSTPAIESSTSTGVSGTGEPGSTVCISEGTTQLGCATVGADGTWTISLGVLPGAHTLTATVTDAAGNTGAGQSFRFASTHAGDSDGDWRIGLPELLRMVELFNTTEGSIRTGAYHSDNAAADGFAPGAGPLPYYHTADTDRDGRLSLPELLRTIELYNAMSGTTRTGAYHIDSSTADGFATGAN